MLSNPHRLLVKIPAVALCLFPESGRAEAGNGDLLEQVRAGHDG